MAYASGKKAWGISDRSGWRYRLNTMRVEWTGAKVGPDEWEAKQPQLKPPPVSPDPQALRDPRPQSNLAAERVIQYGWNPVGMASNDGLTPNDLPGTGEIGTVTVVIT